MKLFEISVEYHKELNSKIWKDNALKRDVRDKLLEIADEFIEYLDLPSLDVEDIILTGSMANFNWTSLSDLDLHLVVNLDEMKERCPEFTDDFFTDKKSLWNERHEIEIHGHPVELYVQDAGEEHIASGVYSVQNDEWIKEPSYSPPSYDAEDVRIKSEQFKKEIDRVIDNKGSIETVKTLKKKIRQYRKAGLQDEGEYSVENLVFKELRNEGYLERLSKYARKAQSKELSLP